MGTEYYIIDKDKNELFELGKHLYLDRLNENFSLWINDELSFKMLIINEISEIHPEWTIAGCVALTNDIWNFCKQRKNLSVVSEHFIFEGYMDFNKCTLVGTRYNGIEEDYLKETSDRWASYYEKSKAKHTPEKFEELKKYFQQK